ncbi:MAG: radical SAM protein [Bacteroidales bacterium]|jgi:MoaA/NifB/PqqE/SkfB family radical SAM enzyme|nr:radical SAM protein [Bacteroidales bacterium]MCI2145905.1 radical SAM protein [Bacteroidales bacterium]
MDTKKMLEFMTKATQNPVLSPMLVKEIEKALYKNIVTNNTKNLPAVQEKKYDFVSALINCLMKNIRKHDISKEAIDKLVNIFAYDGMMSANVEKQKANDSYIDKHGYNAPSFLVISPSQACNLHCSGCYACSDPHTSPHLSFDVTDRIVREFRDITGGTFVVVSGGEPLMYKDGDKGLLDLFAKYPDMYFMFYTNSTLIDKKTAARLAELGNASPAISVEGYEAETDARRGKGTYAKILQAFANLREVGVPFGVSVTSTSKNAELLLEDKFYDFYFEQQGISYMWQFQFMPIGRGKDVFDLMVQPKDRVRLYREWEHQMHDKKHCVADFWNSGVLASGCVAYGGNGGYVYIDWNGNVMPCVFVPYYTDNILKLYDEGKTLEDAYESTLMKNGRKWQNEYSLNDKMHSSNLLMPCSIRDHYLNFKKAILTDNTNGENEVAQDIMSEEEYVKHFDDYDRELSDLTQPIWEKEYLKAEVKEKEKKAPGNN